MNAATALASRLSEVILDGQWIANTNYKAQLSDLSWEQAITQVENFNTIAALTFHIDYYISGVLQVLEGGPLDIRDRYSFDMPPLQRQEDWDALRDKLWRDTTAFINATGKLSDEQLDDVFVDAKYGTYRRNIDGLIEHAYYHLGQIVLIKKMVF